MVAVFYFKLILNKINKKYANAPVINTNKMKKYMNGKDFIDINTEKDLNNIDPKFRDEYKQTYVRKLGDGKYPTKVVIR